ncbi:MAG: 50S ribosome-binding GTPase [Candidatus Lokiarchaeota archaeon]|nr:50S ribosome-binding GTPase [Candidatus Lokiarchaeota archaeon]
MPDFATNADKKKILIAGLDNAGKTSIIDLVQHKMVQTLSMNPTKGVARREAEILGQSFVLHDLGGQEQYRQVYLSQASKYFLETGAVVFVVDLQDKERYGDALGYFEAILGILKGLRIAPRLYVFFHKFDHAYKTEYNDPARPAREAYNQLRDKFISAARAGSLSVYDFYKTSIFDEWSCYAAFFEIWSSFITRLDSIQSYLERVTESVPGVLLSLLLDENSNVLGKHFAQDMKVAVDKLIELATASIKALAEFKRTGMGAKLGETNTVTTNVGGRAVHIRGFDAGGRSFYLAVARDTADDEAMRAAIDHIAYSMSIFSAAKE